MYNIDTLEQVAAHRCGFDGVPRGNNSEESRLAERSLWKVWESLKMERLQVKMRSQER